MSETGTRFVALQHRDFRLLWLGRLLSNTGSQMQYIAVNWHIFALLREQSVTVTILGWTRELDAGALGLGSLGLVRIVPIILFALLGGIVADTRDRRQMLIITQAALAASSLLLAVLTLSGQITVSLIYVLTAVQAGIGAFDEPAKQAIVPNLVPRKHLTNAISLTTLVRYLTTVIGPAVAGLLVAQFDVGVVYAIDVVSFTAVIIALLLMHYRPVVRQTAVAIDWQGIKEGILFTYRTRLIWSTMLLDFLATFFGSARTMLPIVATDVLGMGATGYGILATAQPIGAIVAGVILSWRQNIRRQGVVLLVSITVYGLATAAFGLSTLFGLSYFLFSLTGAGDTVSTVIRGTLRQMLTPDHLRGRMTSVNMIFFMGGPQLGEVEAGLIAALFGAPIAIVTGGVATVLLTAVIAWRYPSLRRYEST